VLPHSLNNKWGSFTCYSVWSLRISKDKNQLNNASHCKTRILIQLTSRSCNSPQLPSTLGYYTWSRSSRVRMFKEFTRIHTKPLLWSKSRMLLQFRFLSISFDLFRLKYCISCRNKLYNARTDFVKAYFAYNSVSLLKDYEGSRGIASTSLSRHCSLFWGLLFLVIYYPWP